METIHFFRESLKRRASLGINIPLFSPTRWSEKYKSIRIFKCNFKRILDALGFLMSNGSSETRATAFSLKSVLEKSGVTYAVCLMPYRESTSQYFHRAIYLQYVDGLSCSLRVRFSDNPSLFALLSLLPPNKTIQIDEIERSYSLDNVESEVSLWRSSLSPEVNHECLQEIFMSTQDYPSVRSAIQMIMALPSTTV